MKRPRRVAVVLAILVVVLLAGGAYGGLRLVREARELESLRKVAQAEETAFRAYRRDPAPEATQALASLAQLLESEAARSSGRPQGRSLAFDLALTYGRLAKLSAASGADDRRDEYLARAREWYVKSGQSRRDTAQLLDLVARADEAGDRGEKAAQQ